jgi:hypothetical protein
MLNEKLTQQNLLPKASADWIYLDTGQPINVDSGPLPTK